MGSNGSRGLDTGLWSARTGYSRFLEAGSAVAVLQAFYVSGGALLLLSAWLPGGGDRSAALIGTAGGLFLAACALAILPTPPEPVLHGLVAAGSVVTCGLVALSAGGVLSGLFGAYLVWIGVFTGLFFSVRATVVHLLLVAVLGYAAFATATSPSHAVLYALLGAGPAVTAGYVTGYLVRARRFAATHDPTTGVLASATALSDVVRCTLNRRGAVLLLLDLERLVELYEAFGKAAADGLLRDVAARLRGMSPGPVAIARWGGHELVLLFEDAALPGGEPAVGCRRIAEQVLTTLAEPFTVGGACLRVVGRAGVASAEAGSDPDTALSRAAVALGSAHREVQRVAVWHPGLSGVDPEDLALLEELRTAGDRGQLRLEYQPIVSTRTGACTGLEALVRWRHPQRGLLSPAVFVPVAERHGVVEELTTWVLDEALRQLAAWRSDGLRLAVAVNLSPAALHESRLPAVVSERLMARGVPAAALTLEITETAVAEHPERAHRALEELREIGVRLSLDDFGTGYTSLRMLADLPLDEVKVDRAFVGRMLEDEARCAIATAVRGLGTSLGLAVVAEGIEDAATLARVSELGFDFAQGFHIARPVPASEVPKLVCRLPAEFGARRR